jgi:hypothetical protein
LQRLVVEIFGFQIFLYLIPKIEFALHEIPEPSVSDGGGSYTTGAAFTLKKASKDIATECPFKAMPWNNALNIGRSLGRPPFTSLDLDGFPWFIPQTILLDQ